MNNIITEVLPAVNTITFIEVRPVIKLRDNVFMCDDDSIVVGGPLYAAGGYLFCQSCEDAGCEHCHEVFNAWLGDRIVTKEQYIPFDGSPLPIIEEGRRDYAL